jgi:hypothetical protein
MCAPSHFDQPSVDQSDFACARIFDQRAVMGGDQHGRSQPVEFAEQSDQSLADFRIDIAGRLVGEKQIGTGDDGARDGDTLLLAAGQRGGSGVQAVGEPHPAQQFFHVLGVIVGTAAGEPQGQRDIVEGRKMIEQPESPGTPPRSAASAPQRRSAWWSPDRCRTG